MRRICGLLLALPGFLAALIWYDAAPLAAQPAQDPPSVAGFWQAYGDDGKPSGWFLFAERDGFFEGRPVRTFDDEGAEAKGEICAACPGLQKNAPMLGLVIVSGMKRDGLRYGGGQILDPRDGTLYRAQMEVSPDGQKLSLRGYIAVPLLGQTRVWTRLPDDALPARAAHEPSLPSKKSAPPIVKPQKNFDGSGFNLRLGRV